MTAKEQNWIEYKQRSYLKDLLPLDTPLSIQIEPSRACNFKCIYCSHFNENEADNKVMLYLNSFKKFVKDAKKLPRKFKVLTFAGLGEPLLNKNIFDMVKLSKEIAQSVALVTNGSLLTKQNTDKLIGGGIDTIRISLQGLNAQDYYNTCGCKLDFDKFLSNLDYLYKNKKQCEVILKMPDIIINDEEKREHFHKIFADKCDVLTIQDIVPISDEINYKNIKSDFSTTVYQQKVKKFDVCPQPFYTSIIKADGSVQPCCNWASVFVIGNIKKDDFSELWNGDEIRKVRLIQLKKPIKFCQTCPIPLYMISELDCIDDIKTELIREYEGD